MAEGSQRYHGLLELWAAHRELSALEWLECRQTVLSAAKWLLCSVISGLAGWLALQAAVVIAFHQQPLRAALSVAALNAVAAAVTGWQASRLLRRPFFALTRREAAREVGSLVRVIS
jgi:uncharacterized membrane protein YqjE